MKKAGLVLIILSILIGCKAKEESARNSSDNSGNNQTTSNTMQNEEIYDIVVSFISKGEGIDEKTRDEFVKTFKMKNEEFKTRIFIEQVHWGREGEIDYCIKLDNLSTAQQKDLKKALQNVIKNNDLVQYQENAPCVHKRSR